MTKLYAYYHTYLTDDLGTWMGILQEQLKVIQDSKLYDALDELNITAIVPLGDLMKESGGGRQEILSKFIRTAAPKATIHLVPNPSSNDDEMLRSRDQVNPQLVREAITHEAMWNRAQFEDAHFLYFHMKGITAQKALLEKGLADRYHIYHAWRAFLNWGVLENWRNMRESLRTCDLAGVNYQSEPAPHFSGGFWWATSNWIKQLPNPSNLSWWENFQKQQSNPWLATAQSRFADEFWITSQGSPKVWNIFTPKENPAFNYLPRFEYEYMENQDPPIAEVEEFHAKNSPERTVSTYESLPPLPQILSFDQFEAKITKINKLRINDEVRDRTNVELTRKFEVKDQKTMDPSPAEEEGIFWHPV